MKRDGNERREVKRRKRQRPREVQESAGGGGKGAI